MLQFFSRKSSSYKSTELIYPYHSYKYLGCNKNQPKSLNAMIKHEKYVIAYSQLLSMHISIYLTLT